jgi:uncharacterized protein (DUF433 family)
MESGVVQIDQHGIPRTINRRVKVMMIAQKHLKAGESIEAIADHYGITLADVHAALAYYYDNRIFFEQHEQKLQPYIEDAQRYSDQLKQKIQGRLNRSNKAD